MISAFLRKIFSSRSRNLSKDIAPDEIFLDSSNLPQFDTDQFEGRLDKPIRGKTLFYLGLFFFLIILVFGARTAILQIKDGNKYLARSQNNSLKYSTVFAERGIVSDKKGELLIWNTVNPLNNDFSLRQYSGSSGLSHILGYLKYPTQDKSGVYYQLEYDGKSGIEKYYNDLLAGENGLKITETYAHGKITSESVIQSPKTGENIKLTLDSRVQSKLFKVMTETAKNVGFKGGAAVIIDVTNGEIVALTSFPEYDSQVITDGADNEKIASWLISKDVPLLNRAVSGLYVPGSIVKPYIALGALSEGVIDPEHQIMGTASISIPNPYNPKLSTVFKDWQAQGLVDMRKAIAMSSDV